MLVNLENLKTARENAGYTTLEAAKKICPSTKGNRVAQWEAGELRPTWHQLKALGNAYQINTFLLTSDEKITRNRVIKDYRKHETGGELELNARKFIHFLLQRQDYLAKVMKEAGMRKNTLVGMVKNSTYRDAPRIAQFITDRINYRYDESVGNNHLKYFISLLENQGIYVMKTLSYWKISVKNMRGVYLKNDYAPIIALNRKDAKTAQLFTLAHELAHLFTNSEGVSNIDFRCRSNDPTEIFCNAVAANLLLPEERIERRRHHIDELEEIAKRFQISKLFVFYRLKNLGLLGRQDLYSIEEKLKKMADDFSAKQGKDQGGNYINNMRDSNGYLFNNFISSLYFERKINAAETTKILKLSIDKV
ncbi:MAG: ImmA/IrrE family metallo-endopeptidase [Chromatiales bacterium]|nr:ImmA/IrrE family metallo-endopeptidase [Chromatiales bacterium]